MSEPADRPVAMPSIEPTYDSRDTGPRYWVTTELNGRTLSFRTPIADPFVRTTVTITWRDLLRGLLRRRLTVTVTVGGDTEVLNDVLELDSNALVPGRTRRQDFRRQIHQHLANLAQDES